MDADKKTMGRAGEDAAAEWLVLQGYEVLYRNWYGSKGELDIICRKGDTVHIVEVRCRRAGSRVRVEESMGRKKMEALRETCAEFLYVHGLGDSFVSVDLAVCEYRDGSAAVTDFLENVL
ncbi:MAG: YraN family protein [Abditibacteriota bacterium]|nr:YraN family protein [Abditibacteriota bacterium]